MLLLLNLILSDAALAGNFKAGDIAIGDPWARATPPVAGNGAGYLTLHNAGSEKNALISASAGICETTELHTHIMENDMMMMRQVERIEIPAGERVQLKPGGFHIMFIGLEAPLEEGQSFPLTLTFETGGEVTVDVVIRKE